MDFMNRVVADSRNRPDWLAKRVGKVGASDAAGYAKLTSVPLYVKAKIAENFSGNHYTRHGDAREAAILRRYNVEQNTLMFSAPGNPLHVCTPDGFIVGGETGELILVQVKTSSKPISKITPAYQRQLLWEQHVMGAQRTLFVWEEHDGFTPTAMDPQSMWFHRDQDRIDTLIEIADGVLEGLAEYEQFKREREPQHV